MTPGERIRARRLELGLMQRDLACPGVTPSYVSRIEAGMRKPTALALRRIAEKLGVSPHWLETGVEDPAVMLARIVLAHPDEPLPAAAKTIAQAVLGSSSR